MPYDAIPNEIQPGVHRVASANKVSVTIYNDERVFQFNDDEKISDFTEEHNGFLLLLSKQARRQIELGARKDGCLKGETFLQQEKDAVAIAEESTTLILIHLYGYLTTPRIMRPKQKTLSLRQE